MRSLTLRLAAFGLVSVLLSAPLAFAQANHPDDKAAHAVFDIEDSRFADINKLWLTIEHPL